jgi:hypothetical protein
LSRWAVLVVIAGVSATAAAEEPSGEPYEVIVDGELAEPDRHSLEQEEARRLPGAFGDPFRAIEALPGVTPTVSGLPFFFVRGAPPGNTGYFIDEVRVPYLFHAVGGPSVIHPRLIERVDLHPGGYPARLGRYAGGVVAATTTEPRADWHGEGQLRLIDTGALVEGGFADGRGTALLAGRYSYTGAIFSAISPELTLDYRDFQARVSFDLTERDRVSVFAFGAYDYYAEAKRGGDRPIFATEFYRIDTRYDVRLARGGRLRAAVTTGFDNTIMNDLRKPRNVVVGSRITLTQPVSDELAIDVGFDTEHDVYDVDDPPYFDPDDTVAVGYNDLFRSRNDAAASTWLGLEYRPSPGVLIAPGIRLDGFLSGADKAVSVDPRLRVAIALTDELRFLSAIGVAHQPPAYLVAIPGLSPSRLEEGLQRSIQASAGAELDLPWSTTASVTVFDNVFLDMTDSAGSDKLFTLPYEVPRSMGSSKGIEVYLRRSLARRLGGYLAYTLSRTARSEGSSHHAASFDRTHVLSAALGYDFGGGWLGGTRLSLASGAPNVTLGRGGRDGGGVVQRDPLTYRVDFRFEKKWQLGHDGWMSLVLEMVNATFHAEVVHGERLTPVALPSIGLEGGFR